MDEFRLSILNGQRDLDRWVRENARTAMRAEFLAFTRAVTELFGPEQARQSAEDWFNELASKDCMPGPSMCEWQLVTVAAMARLTIRMTTELQHSRTARPFG